MNQITAKDFDNAVKQDWYCDSCLIAQADKRLHGDTNVASRGSIVSKFARAASAMGAFDRHFEKPGDEQKPELQALRASLPIELEASDPKGADSVQKGNEKL